MYTLNLIIGGHGFRTSLNKLGEAASARDLPRNRSRSVRTRSSTYWLLQSAVSPFSYYTLSPVSNLNPYWTPSPYLKPLCHLELSISALPAWAAQPAGEPSFFNDYKSAVVHYSRSSFCNKSMRGIKAVTVQLNTRPQHVGDGEAGGGGAPGAWRPQPAPSRSTGVMI